MATILLLLFFTIFYHRETASDGYNLTGTISHHFYHRETASDGYNLTGTIFHHFFSTGKQPVMATILLVLFFTIFFYHRETASDGYNLTGAIFHHFFYHRETASDGYNLTGAIFHHFFFTTGRQPVMATILLVLFFTIFLPQGDSQ